MKELVRIEESVIGTEKRKNVNARDLWKALGSKRQFGNWIEDRLSGFVEGQDFTINKIVKTGKGASGKQLYKEYIITLDVAKHLAMLALEEAENILPGFCEALASGRIRAASVPVIEFKQ